MVLVQFAMNTILLYTGDPARHIQTYELYNTVLENAGYRLLTDDMYEIARRSMETAPRTEGATRYTERTRQTGATDAATLSNLSPL
jgi:hypothetical protein